MKKTTLALIINDSKVLLGYTGKIWNGPGGKFKTGESAKEALIRETKEEVDISLNLWRLKPVGNIEFFFAGKPIFDMYIFLTNFWYGVPKPKSEMTRVEWIDIDKVPYHEMWLSDRYWMPEVLKGRKIKNTPMIFYNADGTALEREPEIEFY